MNAAIDCISVRDHASKDDLIASSQSLFTGASSHDLLHLQLTWNITLFLR